MAKHYDREFKIEAVKLASEPGMTQAQVEKNDLSQQRFLFCKTPVDPVWGNGCFLFGDR